MLESHLDTEFGGDMFSPLHTCSTLSLIFCCLADEKHLFQRVHFACVKYHDANYAQKISLEYYTK